jgi:LysM repeat protein
MNRDDEFKEAPRRPSAKKRVSSDRLTFSGERVRRGRAAAQPFPTYQPQAHPVPRGALKVEPITRRGPSYPAWERPLSQQEFPRLHGRAEARSMWPLISAVFCVVILVVGALVIIPALTGHWANVAGATATATATATARGSAKPSGSNSGHPSASVGVSPSPTPTSVGTPGPEISYGSYKVRLGDTLSSIARQYGLQKWELLVANPQITDPNNVKLGTILRIPPPGVLTPPPVSTPTGTPEAP